MTTTKRELLTADDLLRLHSQGVKGELILGVFVESVASGVEHGEIAIFIAAQLLAIVKPQGLGRVIGTDSGVLLQNGPDVVREPDVAYISAERLPLDERVRGYLPVAPDLVVEIASPNDADREVYDKARMWLSHGVSIVWLVDPDSRSVTVHSPDAATYDLTDADTLDGGGVLPGFTLPVRDIFD
jgi:Uma2 family endonuclease